MENRKKRDLQIFPDLSEQDVADSIEIVRTIARDLGSSSSSPPLEKKKRFLNIFDQIHQIVDRQSLN